MGARLRSGKGPITWAIENNIRASMAYLGADAVRAGSPWKSTNSSVSRFRWATMISDCAVRALPTVPLRETSLHTKRTTTALKSEPVSRYAPSITRLFSERARAASEPKCTYRGLRAAKGEILGNSITLEIAGQSHYSAAIRMRCARTSWRVPAGESPARVRGSSRPIVSVAAWAVTTTAKRTQQSCGAWE